jgi:hypothetical protein
MLLAVLKFDRKFDDGEDVTGDLDLAGIRSPVPRGELAVVWDLAAAINVGWWRALGARTWAAAAFR